MPLYNTDTYTPNSTPTIFFGGTAEFGYRANAEDEWTLECMWHQRKVFPCLAFLNPQSQPSDRPTVTSKKIQMSSAVVFMAITCQKAAVFMCICCGCLWYCIQSMFETELDSQGEKADVKWHFLFFFPHLCERVYMTRNSQHASTDTHFPFGFTSLPASQQPWLTP